MSKEKNTAPSKEPEDNLYRDIRAVPNNTYPDHRTISRRNGRFVLSYSNREKTNNSSISR